MAYQFADGFDNYNTGTTLSAGYPWDTISGTATVLTTDQRFVAPGSLTSGCVSIPQNNYIRKNLSGTPATLIIGFGFKLTALPAANPNDILTLWDGGNFQGSLAVTANGALQWYRGNGSAPGGGGIALSVAVGSATPNGTIAANTWYGIALKVKIDPAVGFVQLYINGSTTAAINSTGLNTRGTANSQATQLSLGNTANAGFNTVKYDDFYCLDTSGTFLTDLLGADARIITKLPASAGSYTNWTPNGLGSNFQNVAVTPPSTSDYNANNVATTKDSYTMQFASLGVAPFAVISRASMERDDAGPHTPSLFVRSGSTDGAGVVTPALSASYAFYDAVFQNDPATNAAWTALGADNAQAGVIEG